MPSPFTEQEKQRFLELTREGWDRGAAARMVNPQYTGRMFHRLTKAHMTHFYDPEFTEAYNDAVAEGEPHRKSSRDLEMDFKQVATITASGFTKARFITDSQKQQLLSAIRDGIPISAAVAMVEPRTSASQFRSLQKFDAEFADAYREACEEGYPNYQDEIRSMIWETAQAGDYRAQRDLALAHLPEYQKLLPAKLQQGLDVGSIQVFINKYGGQLAPDVLDSFIRELERAERQALPDIEQDNGKRDDAER